MNEKRKNEIPINKDPNAVGKLFEKESGEATGHEGASLPYSGGTQSGESGGSRVKDQDPLKDSV